MTIIDRRYSVAEGQAIKAPCRVATTANITLEGLQTIDDVAVVSDDRVLVKNQTTGADNGIYAVSTGNWTRERDFDGAYDIVTGTSIFITAGTVNGTLSYVVTTAGDITVGTTTLSFSAIAGGYLLIWQGAWVDPTAYALNSGVENDGSSYISILAHTSDSTTEPGVGASWETYWDLLAVGGFTIPDSSVTYAKIQNVSSTDRLLGRSTAGAGVVEEIPLSSAGRALIDDASAGDQRTTLGLGDTVTFDEATPAEYKAQTADKVLTTDVWDSGEEVVTTYASSVALDFSTLINTVITLTGDLELANPTNVKAGQSGLIRLVQDGTGSRLITYGSNWLAGGSGSSYLLSTGANIEDYFFYHAVTSSVIFLTAIRDVQ